MRLAGWRLCAGGPACRSSLRPEADAVRLVDGRWLGPGCRHDLLHAERLPGRSVLLGVDAPAERAALLAAGCGEALPANIALPELAVRARRLAQSGGLLPRLRRAGAVMLDLLHRDGRVEAAQSQHWLSLHPREFALLWRLAEQPGCSVTRAELLRDVWRLRHEPETNSVAVHVSRLRAKLSANGLDGLVATDPAGGYRLVPPAG